MTESYSVTEARKPFSTQVRVGLKAWRQLPGGGCEDESACEKRDAEKRYLKESTIALYEETIAKLKGEITELRAEKESWGNEFSAVTHMKSQVEELRQFLSESVARTKKAMLVIEAAKEFTRAQLKDLFYAPQGGIIRMGVQVSGEWS